jgi:hypothetical protein
MQCVVDIDKGKSHPIAVHEVSDRELSYSCTLSLTSAVDGVGGQRHALAALSQGKRTGTQFTGGLVSPRVALDGCGNSHPYRDSMRDRPSRRGSLYWLGYSGLLNALIIGNANSSMGKETRSL